MAGWKRAGAPLIAVAACVALGTQVVRPEASAAEVRELAQRFAFDVVNLNERPVDARQARQVAPGLGGIGSWISAVGAAVGLADLRGLGRPADACLVDPRDDSVTIRPVPGGGGPEYPPQPLRANGLPYDHTMAPMGCVPVDLDEDGDQDIVVYYWGRSPIVFLNTAGPSAPPSAEMFQAVELVTPMRVWNSTGLNVADVDGDGHLDVLVANYFPDGARVLDPDAAEDTRMYMQDGMSSATNAGVNRLLLAKPTGRADALPSFVDASDAMPAGVATSWTLAIGFQDLTGDGLPEIYLANDFGPDHLLVNHSAPGRVRLASVRGERDLVTPKSAVLGYDSFKGMGVTFSYDGAAELPMIVVSNITTPFALHESNFAFVPAGPASDLLRGELPYTNRSEELGLSRSGWGWDVKAGDFDNDGVDEFFQATGFLKGTVNRWPELQELAMGNDDVLRFPSAWPNFGPGDDLSGHEHNPFWVRGSQGRYVDLAHALDIDMPDVSRGFAIGDVNADGRLDVLVANQWEDSRVLINRGPGGTAAHVRLQFPTANGHGRPAIGAQVELRDPVRQQKVQLYPANGHAGVSAPGLNLALPGGRAAPATITWRDAAGLHRTEVQLAPGRATIVLNPDGTAVVR